MQSMKIGNGTAIHIRDEKFGFLTPLCGGARVNGPAQAKRLVEGVPTCKACLKKLAKVEVESEAAQEEREETSQQEREEIARTIPDGDLAYWIANPKTGADAEPEQHAAFVAEKARRDQAAYERNQEADRLYGPLISTPQPRGGFVPLKPIYPTALEREEAWEADQEAYDAEVADQAAKPLISAKQNATVAAHAVNTPCDCGAPFTCRTHG